MGTPSPSWKRETRRPPGNLLAVLVAIDADLSQLATDLADSTLTAQEWSDEMAASLEDAHARAAVIGRQYAGDMAARDEDDDKFAALVMDAESEFLDGFRADVEAGKYLTEGAQDAAAIGKRAKLYAGRLVGTANEAFVLASPPDATFDWVLGGTEDHCEACPELAEGGPYTAESLPTVPGNNDTPCLYNCLCRLVRNDGVHGFTTAQG